MTEKQQPKKQDEKQQQEKPRCIICGIPANQYGFCTDHDPQIRKRMYGPKWY